MKGATKWLLKQIRETRIQNGVSEETAGSWIDVDAQTYGRVERGEAGMLIDSYLILARQLGLTGEKLLEACMQHRDEE